MPSSSIKVAHVLVSPEESWGLVFIPKSSSVSSNQECTAIWGRGGRNLKFYYWEIWLALWSFWSVVNTQNSKWALSFKEGLTMRPFSLVAVWGQFCKTAPQSNPHTWSFCFFRKIENEWNNLVFLWLSFKLNVDAFSVFIFEIICCTFG